MLTLVTFVCKTISLMIERMSPGLSAYWASVAMIVIMLTQHPLKGMFRGAGDLGARFKLGLAEVIDGLIAGARNMIGIGIATATAGIIVGSVSLLVFFSDPFTSFFPP